MEDGNRTIMNQKEQIDTVGETLEQIREELVSLKLTNLYSFYHIHSHFNSTFEYRSYKNIYSKNVKN